MRATRRFTKLVATLGGLAGCWFAGAAPVWQGFHLHL